MATKSNLYLPTAAEEKLLVVLLNPELVGINITEKCELAGVDRGVYYKAMKKEAFVSLLNDSTIDMLKGQLGDIVKVFTAKALEGSYNHGKLLLEMGSMYTQHKVIEADLNHTVDIESIIAALDKE